MQQNAACTRSSRTRYTLVPFAALFSASRPTAHFETLLVCLSPASTLSAVHSGSRPVSFSRFYGTASVHRPAVTFRSIFPRLSTTPLAASSPILSLVGLRQLHARPPLASSQPPPSPAPTPIPPAPSAAPSTLPPAAPATEKKKLAALIPTKETTSSIRKLLDLAKPEKQTIYWAIGLLIVSSTISMSVPLTIGKLIDFFASPDKVRRLLSYLLYDRTPRLNFTYRSLACFVNSGTVPRPLVPRRRCRPHVLLHPRSSVQCCPSVPHASFWPAHHRPGPQGRLPQRPSTGGRVCRQGKWRYPQSARE